MLIDCTTLNLRDLDQPQAQIMHLLQQALLHGLVGDSARKDRIGTLLNLHKSLRSTAIPASRAGATGCAEQPGRERRSGW
jgi:hypothetical protein